MADFYLHLLVVAVGLGVCAYKLVDLIRAPRRPALWALWSGFLLLTLAVTAGLRGGDELLSASVIWIVQHVVLLGSLLALELFFWLTVRGGPGLRRYLPRHGLPVVLLGFAMTIAWTVSVRTEAPDFLDLDLGRNGWALAMMLFYVAAFAATMVTIGRFARTWALVADRSWLRRGLRTLAVACWISLGYACHKFAYTVLDATGNPPPWPQGVEILPIAFGVILALSGITMPSWGPRLSAGRRWVRHARSYRRLYPLWRAATSHDGDIVLPVSAPWWYLEFRLYRRVVEIWDGRTAIRDRIDPVRAERARAAAGARGLGGAALAAAVEAECWRAALEPDAVAVTRGAGPPPATGTDLAAEVAFLEQVAQHLRRPSIVAG